MNKLKRKCEDCGKEYNHNWGSSKLGKFNCYKCYIKKKNYMPAFKFTYNPTERQKDAICIMQGYLGVEVLSLVGVSAI